MRFGRKKRKNVRWGSGDGGGVIKKEHLTRTLFSLHDVDRSRRVSSVSLLTTDTGERRE